jgi:AraC-like DNA-binding protein
MINARVSALAQSESERMEQPTSKETVSITKFLGVLRAAQARGVDVAHWCEQLELGGLDDLSIEQHTSLDRYHELWSLAMRELDDASFPLEVARLPIESLNLVALLVMSSATIGQALERGRRFQRLWMSDGSWEQIAAADGELVLCWRAVAPKGRSLGQRASVEFAVAAMVLGMSGLSQRAIAPLRVTFAHSAPASLKAHEATFGCPLAFDEAADTVALPASVLELPVASANEQAARYLEAQCESLRAQLEDPQDLATRLRRLMMDQLRHGELTRERCARWLGVSERTMLRRLGERDTTFQAQLDQVRCTIAHSLLAQRRYTVAEVAALTGFASARAFHRAYRRWFNVSPRGASGAVEAKPRT